MEAKRLGRRLKAFRKLKGYTQIDLARELNIPIGRMGNIERGTSEVPEELLDQISETLSIPKEEITLECESR